jgi:spermidine synthase
MRLQLMLGHLPALLHPAPASVLVVGCGAGVTAGSFALYPEVRRIAIVEIEPLIPQVVATYFKRQNQNVLADPRTEVVYDDARHYLTTTDEQFDVITSDPVHPWVRGSAALYTREYFETIKRRLKPGGIVTQWIPLYETDTEVVRSEFATFFEVFPNAVLWANLQSGRGYDVVLLGRTAPAPIDVTVVGARLVDPTHSRAAEALRAVGFPELLDLVETYAGRASDLAPWVRDAEVNTDRNLRLQYLAGLQADRYESDVIYSDFARYRKYPADLFVGDRSTLEALRSRIVPAR